MPSAFFPFPRIIIFGRFMPTEGKFLEYFSQHAECVVKVAHALKELINDLPNVGVHTRNMQSFEEKADRITHDTIELLHRIFITPLDRDEIHRLITVMDDILDLMEDMSLTISLYDVTNVADEARQLAIICVTCCEGARETMALLSDVNNGRQILTIAHEIDHLESNTDRVMRAAIAKLFRTEDDIKLLIKLKAIYEQLESIADRCGDVTNIIGGIVLESA